MRSTAETFGFALRSYIILTEDCSASDFAVRITLLHKLNTIKFMNTDPKVGYIILQQFEIHIVSDVRPGVILLDQNDKPGWPGSVLW